MIRATLIAVALAAPASAATVNDLTMKIIDGRPAFRPADGLDCYTAKWGGMVIDCALVDAALVRPRRAPCWLRPDLRGPCPVAAAVLAALPAAAPTVLRFAPDFPAGRSGWTGGGGSCCRAHKPEDPPPVAPVPLPWSGMMLATALAAGLILHKRRQT